MRTRLILEWVSTKAAGLRTYKMQTKGGFFKPWKDYHIIFASSDYDALNVYYDLRKKFLNENKVIIVTED